MTLILSPLSSGSFRMAITPYFGHGAMTESLPIIRLILGNILKFLKESEEEIVSIPASKI